MEAQRQLEKEGIHLRVVSMPIRERFASQPAAYQEEVLPAAVIELYQKINTCFRT